ncbi:hypothetical protein [Methylocystis sp.]|uniref:hypothetical protein n=1 Tax=Methylocystis sp. TaxID=1911079 RepID=UPI0025E90635|nr:hypothetical protein [Methylocystis sp.]
MDKEYQIAEAVNAARFVEVVRARAPRGFSEAVKQAAQANQLSTSEFIRAALAEKLQGASPQEREAAINV